MSRSSGRGLAAEKAGWGAKLGDGLGRGIGIHHGFHVNIALVTDVTVGKGSLKVDRIFAAVDYGVVANPDVGVEQVDIAAQRNKLPAYVKVDFWLKPHEAADDAG